MTSEDSTNSINIFSYLDYRRFLKEWYLEAKRKNGFSYRVFSRRAGFTSSNFFKLVIEGQRNLTEESISKFALGLGLSRAESRFFRLMVLFCQSQEPEVKEKNLREMVRFKQVQDLRPLLQDQYDYFSKWYHPVVRELVTSKSFDGSPEWISQQLQPKVSTAQVKQSLGLLTRLKLIEPIDHGEKWRQTTTLISSGAEPHQHILMTYHQNLLDLIQTQILKIPQDQRDVSALTLGISKKRMPQLKKRIQEFRKEILQMVSKDLHAEDVVLLGIQLLPMTKNHSKGKENE